MSDVTPIELPEQARELLVGIAAAVVEDLPPLRLPPSLVAVRRFTPRKRRVAGAEPLLRALGANAVFRYEVRRQWLHAVSEEDEQDIVHRAVGLFLERPEGWEASIHEINCAIEAEVEADLPDAIQLMSDELVEARASIVNLTERVIRLTQERQTLQEHVGDLGKENRKLRSAADRARAQAREADSVVDGARSELLRRLADQESHVQQREAHIARLEAEAERTRMQRGVDAELASVRARLLLDTAIDAVTGLRRELALPTTALRPGDLADGHDPWQAAAVRPDAMGQTGDETDWLDHLLGLPHLHLIVDGYNVSKEAFATLTLAEQRSRLIDELAKIAARFNVEVTCVFDGAPIHGWVPSPSTRRVRVRFSSGEIADDLIRRMVANEPKGRAIAVVTSDAEIARNIATMGAYSVRSVALTRRMARH